MFGANKIAAPEFVELAPVAKNAERFSAAITASKAASGPAGAAVYVYSVEEYQQMRLFLSKDGKSGVAVKNGGDIVSVFSNGGAGRAVMELAVAAGGTKLDAFDTILPEFYSAHGFVATSRLKWDESQAPGGWDKAAMAEFNGGQPDVVFMALDKAYQGDYSAKDGKLGKGDKAYDSALRAQRKAVRQFAPRNFTLYQGGLDGATAGAGRNTADAGSGNARVSAPPVRDDGRIELTHWSSRAGITELDPKFYGKGLTGAEARRRDADPDNWLDRTYFGVAVGQPGGYTKEPGLGARRYTASVDAARLYDLTADPLGLRAQAKAQATGWDNPVSVAERMVRDAGYAGYWVPHPARQPLGQQLTGRRRGPCPVRSSRLETTPTPASPLVPPGSP